MLRIGALSLLIARRAVTEVRFCEFALVDDLMRFYFGLVVQNHLQQGIMDFDCAVVFDETHFAEFVHEKAERPKRSSFIGPSRDRYERS